MQLLVIRHATAAEPVAGSPDALRPLTTAGATEMQRMAASLQRLVPGIAVVGASPLLRAVQTAGILAGAYPRATVMQTEALGPGALPESLLRWLQGEWGSGPVAVVGHEPDLSGWVSWMLTGQRQAFIAFDKAGACLLEFPRPEPGSGRLLWLFAPAQLESFHNA